MYLRDRSQSASQGQITKYISWTDQSLSHGQITKSISWTKSQGLSHRPQRLSQGQATKSISQTSTSISRTGHKVYFKDRSQSLSRGQISLSHGHTTKPISGQITKCISGTDHKVYLTDLSWSQTHAWNKHAPTSKCLLLHSIAQSPGSADHKHTELGAHWSMFCSKVTTLTWLWSKSNLCQLISHLYFTYVSDTFSGETFFTRAASRIFKQDVLLI